VAMDATSCSWYFSRSCPQASSCLGPKLHIPSPLGVQLPGSEDMAVHLSFGFPWLGKGPIVMPASGLLVIWMLLGVSGRTVAVLETGVYDSLSFNRYLCISQLMCPSNSRNWKGPISFFFWMSSSQSSVCGVCQ
jgi:hypothetical protein